MKIAVIAVGYQCERLAEVLAPWITLKQGLRDDFNNILLNRPRNIEIKICCVSALFKERQEHGESYLNDKNSSFLNKYKESGSIDQFIEEKLPILDYQSRNIALNYFKSINYDYDYIWQLDLYDEYYSKEEIFRTIEWIRDNEGFLYDFFRINFKNYFGKEQDKTYVLDFKPVRIINNRRNGGVKHFYFDNDVEFNNGVRTPNCSGTTFSTRICNPTHLSWIGNKKFLIDKINYQHKAIGTCSYRYNLEQDKLEFDIENYYYKYGKEIPVIYKDER